MPHGWNIFLTGDSILPNTATIICSSVLYKYLLNFTVDQLATPKNWKYVRMSFQFDSLTLCYDM